MATKGQVFATAVDHAHTQNVIAHRAHAGAGWAGQTGGHHAANRGARAEVRRLKRQALTVGGQGRLEFRQRRTATGGDKEFTRLVADDAAVAPRVQDFARQWRAPKIFATTAAQAQLATVGRGGAHGVDEVLALCFHGLGCYPPPLTRRMNFLNGGVVGNYGWRWAAKLSHECTGQGERACDWLPPNTTHPPWSMSGWFASKRLSPLK